MNTRHKFITFFLILMALGTTLNAEEKEAKKESRYKSLEAFARAMYYLETMYVDSDRANLETLIEYAKEGVVSRLDPHTVILPKKAFQQLHIDTKGHFGGVGIIISQEKEKLIIVSPIEDTPAYKAGVKSGDEIIAIDNIPLTKLKTQAIDKMRGIPGSILRLRIKRKGLKDSLDFNLKREIIQIKSVRHSPLSDNIYFVRIANFQENTADELQSFLEKHKKSMKGLILDLRDNPGGLLDQSIKVVDQFIDSGLIVSTVGRSPNRIEREFAHKTKTYLGFPIVVLVNGGSASASEIVAGALQDHQRALVMGSQTFGKGSVQTLVSLPDGSGLKLTVARYYTPKDRSIQAKGIQPDIILSTHPIKNETERKKESDLKGHIESSNLSDLPEKSGMLHSTHKWPDHLRKDYQIVTAFTYLKSWSYFKVKKVETSKKSINHSF